MDYEERDREYARITGRGRREGPRPCRDEGVEQIGFRGDAVVRTTAGNAPAALRRERPDAWLEDEHPGYGRAPGTYRNAEAARASVARVPTIIVEAETGSPDDLHESRATEKSKRLATPRLMRCASIVGASLFPATGKTASTIREIAASAPKSRPTRTW